ncbi:uncharacterized protein [Lolium perenne]|uniref:uncharacterized protein n=1 Tax=Lolium perenne TaxID=4522 RepID=UPI0021F6023E|nr:uncharacterized protein LOC127326784 [Lolium perenne]
MTPMTPELKAYLDEWKAEHKRMYDEMLDTLRRPLTEFGAVDHDNSTPSINTTGGGGGPVQASSGTTEIILASAWLAEPPPPAPTTTTPLVVAAAVPIDTSVVTRSSCSAECTAQAVIASEGTAPASSSLSSTATVAVLAAPTCFKPAQNTTFPTSGVTTMTLLQEGLPELVHLPAAFVSATPANSGKTTLEVAPSTSVGFITIVSTTCSTYCSVRQPRAAPWLVTPSLPIATEYSDQELFRPSPSRRITSRVPVHRPMPWPSFMDVQADGDEMWPLPWPSFRENHAYGDETRPLPWPSLACDIGPVQRESWPPTEDRAPLSILSMFNGNRSTSYGYIIGIVLCSPSGIYCLDDVLSFLEYWGCTNDCVHSAHPYHTTFIWLPCSISGFQFIVMARSLELKLLSNGSTPITSLTVLWDSGNYAALSCEYLGIDTIVCIDSWFFAGCSVGVCQEYSVQSSTDYFIARESASGVLSTMDLHLFDSPCRSAVTVFSSQLKESLIMNSMKRSVGSYDQFSGAIQDASYCPGYFVAGSRMNLVFTAASTDSRWFVSCVCDDPAISSSIVVLCDELVLQPWDPGHQTVISDFTKVFYSQAIFDIYLKKLMSQSLKVSGSTGYVFLLSSKCYHKSMYTTVHDLLSKMSDGWDYMIFNDGTSFSLDLHIIISLPDSDSPSHAVLLSFRGKPHRIVISVTSTIFWDACLSVLIICKMWRQNQYVQMLIWWPPRAHVWFVTIKDDMPFLLVEMRIPSSPTCTGNLLDAEQWVTTLDYYFNAIKDVDTHAASVVKDARISHSNKVSYRFDAMRG